MASERRALHRASASASYDATLAALEHAGAEPGDVVHAFGHSQGAMVAAHLALEGEFDTQTLVSFGSPVEADVGDGTLSISLRHGDDPVAALAGGGHAGTVGRTGQLHRGARRPTRAGLHDLRHARARHRSVHRDGGARWTPRTTPRMDAVREVFDELGAAASVEVTEYAAERVAAGPQPTGAAAVSPSSGAAG